MLRQTLSELLVHQEQFLDSTKNLRMWCQFSSLRKLKNLWTGQSWYFSSHSEFIQVYWVLLFWHSWEAHTVFDLQNLHWRLLKYTITIWRKESTLSLLILTLLWTLLSTYDWRQYIDDGRCEWIVTRDVALRLNCQYQVRAGCNKVTEIYQVPVPFLIVKHFTCWPQIMSCDRDTQRVCLYSSMFLQAWRCRAWTMFCLVRIAWLRQIE